MKKQRPLGVQFGIICLVFGVAGAVTNLIAMKNGKVLTTVMGVTPMLLISGIVFLILQGKTPPAEVAENERIKHWWKNTPNVTKTVWGVSALVGIGIGLWMVFTFTDFTG